MCHVRGRAAAGACHRTAAKILCELPAVQSRAVRPPALALVRPRRLANVLVGDVLLLSRTPLAGMHASGTAANSAAL